VKILHIAYIYPPELCVADGITSVVYNVTKELAENGHEVAVYASNMIDLHGSRSLPVGHSVINGVNVYYFRSIWHSKTFVVTPGLFSVLWKNANQYDVIHIHDCRSFQGIIAYFIARLKRIPYIFHPHGSFISPMPISTNRKISRIVLDKLVSERIVRHASKLIALSHVEAAQFVNIGIPEEKIRVIGNGIDLHMYVNLPPKGSFKKKFSINSSNEILLYLGRLNKTKNILFLLQSYYYLKKKLGYKNIVLVIAGSDDGYLNTIKNTIKALGLDKDVVVTGFLSEKDKLSAYVDSSLCAYMGSLEPFGLVILEAAACKTPIIVSNDAPMAKILKDGRFGFSAKANNPVEFSQILERILSDEPLIEFGKRGRNYVFKNFSWKNQISKLEALYKLAINS
jgi:glycosyltransferase involved in cell wall biosynthesis